MILSSLLPDLEGATYRAGNLRLPDKESENWPIVLSNAVFNDIMSKLLRLSTKAKEIAGAQIPFGHQIRSSDWFKLDWIYHSMLTYFRLISVTADDQINLATTVL